MVSEVSDSTTTPIEVYFILDMLTFRKIFYPQKKKQECILVGCVPSAAVAVPGGVSACHTHTHTRVNRMTDMFKNITLPQLRCGR